MYVNLSLYCWLECDIERIIFYYDYFLNINIMMFKVSFFLEFKFLMWFMFLLINNKMNNKKIIIKMWKSMVFW